MKQGLQLKFSQNLSLTPQLQQAIRLLQLSTLELNQEIDVLMQTNPLLERGDDNEDEYGNPTEVASEDASLTVASSSVEAVQEDSKTQEDETVDREFSADDFEFNATELGASALNISEPSQLAE